MNADVRRIERILGVVALALLLLGCLTVLWPFVSAMLWALVLCVCTWPLHAKLLARVKGRRSLAAGLMTMGIALVLLVPFLVMGYSLAGNVQDLAGATRQWVESAPREPPAWLDRVPLAGEWIAGYWRSTAGDGPKLAQEIKRLIEPASLWLLGRSGKVLRGVLDMALSVLITFFLFRDGEWLTRRLMTGLNRIAGERSRHLVDLAVRTVRGVVNGILGTALAQAVLAAIGFLIAGVPGPALLGLLTFFLSIIPFGPPLVWIPAALWLFSHGSTGWGIFMLLWGFLLVSSLDNVIRPWLISQGNKMPFVLILMGVLGGVAAFGFIGVFLGPTLLAVGYRLIDEWTRRTPPAAAPAP